jgi:AcrR family transcriptional regulator
MAATRELFALHGVGGVITQQIADHADIAIGTLYLYAATKAELLIMVQNQKFATAIDAGFAATAEVRGTLEGGDGPDTPRGDLRARARGKRPQLPARTRVRRPGRTLSARRPHSRGPSGGRLKALLTCDERINAQDAATLARVITAILHLSTTATLYMDRSAEEVLADVREQIQATLAQHKPRI